MPIDISTQKKKQQNTLKEKQITPNNNTDTIETITNVKQVGDKRLEAKHKFKDLYIFDGYDFVTIKESISIRHIRSLIHAIEDAEHTTTIVNKMNNKLLVEADNLIDNEITVEDIESLQGFIKVIMDNQKNLSSFIKDAPNWIETLKQLENRVLSDIREDVELLGKKVKAFREDRENTYDLNKALEITEVRFK